MFLKNKKNYELNYIEKIFARIPLVFIVILSMSLMVISYFILDIKENKQIDLLVQKSLLHYDFNKKEKLNEFISSINKNIQNKFLQKELTIKEVVYNVSGYLKADNLNDFYETKKYFSRIESKYGVKLALFKKGDLGIYYGQESIDYIQNIIFNSKPSKEYEDITLKYIHSQGRYNLQYWTDDVENAMQMSFFDKIYINKQEYFIGAFSSIGSIRNVTINTILKTIKDDENHYWFYDTITNNTYNFYNEDTFKSGSKLLVKKINKSSYNVLDYYFDNLEYNNDFKNYTYLYTKYNFLIVNNHKPSLVINELKKTIYDIKYEYRVLLIQALLSVVLITIILMIFSYFFTEFINRTFKKYNEDLQYWKKRFELAIIASNDGLWDIDYKNDKVFFSKKWLDMFGYDANEIQSFDDWFFLVHNEDKEKVKNSFENIFNNKESTIELEYRIRTKKGTFSWVLARGKAFNDDAGNLDRILIMSMDIDKSKRLKKELLDVELLVEDGEIVIFKLFNDKNLSVKYMSNSIKKYGFKKEDFESKKLNFMDVLYKDDIPWFKEKLQKAIKEDLNDFSFIGRILNKKNKIKWVSYRSILIKNNDGKIVFIYGYINDITKMKLSEEELKQKVKDELAKNRQKDKILIQQSKLASMGEMLGAIAHQWRQPLNNMSLIIQFLGDNYNNTDIEKEKLDGYINKAKYNIDYMSDTIDDFRDFYKPSKAKKEFGVKSTVKSIIYLVKKQYEMKDIHIKSKIENIKINTYENELKQALLNILNNANDALLAKKEKVEFDAIINIRVYKRNKKLNIVISNNGGKIKEELLDRIFEPYFSTKKDVKSTGIGLYMTKSIIETNMNGSIKVKNTKNGVKFKINLDAN